MSMRRKVQSSIWRLNMRCPTYSQVTTGQSQSCEWRDEDYNSITEHWLRHFPAMGYWPELMTARLAEHEAFLDDRENNNCNTQFTERSSLQRDHRFTKLSSSRAKFVNITN